MSEEYAAGVWPHPLLCRWSFFMKRKFTPFRKRGVKRFLGYGIMAVVNVDQNCGLPIAKRTRSGTDTDAIDRKDSACCPA